MSQNESKPFLVTDAKNLTLIDATRDKTWSLVSNSSLSKTIALGSLESLKNIWF